MKLMKIDSILYNILTSGNVVTLSVFTPGRDLNESENIVRKPKLKYLFLNIASYVAFPVKKIGNAISISLFFSKLSLFI